MPALPSSLPHSGRVRGPAALVSSFGQRGGRGGGGGGPVGQGPLLLREGRRLVVRHAEGTDGRITHLCIAAVLHDILTHLFHFLLLSHFSTISSHIFWYNWVMAMANGYICYCNTLSGPGKCHKFGCWWFSATQIIPQSSERREPSLWRGGESGRMGQILA